MADIIKKLNISNLLAINKNTRPELLLFMNLQHLQTTLTKSAFREKCLSLFE